MEIDWGQAFYIGGAGFGTVLVVLSVLAGAILLVAKVLKRISNGRDKVNIKRKGN